MKRRMTPYRLERKQGKSYAEIVADAKDMTDQEKHEAIMQSKGHRVFNMI